MIWRSSNIRHCRTHSVRCFTTSCWIWWRQ